MAREILSISSGRSSCFCVDYHNQFIYNGIWEAVDGSREYSSRSTPAEANLLLGYPILNEGQRPKN